MRKVEEIITEIGKVSNAYKQAVKKQERCERRLEELNAELREAEKGEK